MRKGARRGCDGRRVMRIERRRGRRKEAETLMRGAWREREREGGPKGNGMVRAREKGPCVN